MHSIERLLQIMEKLRDKETGCPWDVEQNFATIAPHTIEEAYEVADAIERGNLDDLKEELGDLLLQVVFHAQMAKEQKSFAFDDVVHAICDKLTRRHPHVFGDAKITTAEQQTASWETIKAQEKKSRGTSSALDGVPLNLPALSRAEKLQKKAAKVGFDWPKVDLVLDKMMEEITELRKAIQAGNPEEQREEIGDVLFVVANIAKHLGIDPESALRGTNAKFERRFYFIEYELDQQHRCMKDASLQELDELWDKAKLAERSKRDIAV